MLVGCALISASRIRQIWEVVEQTQSHTLLHLNDSEIIWQILSELQYQQALNTQEIQDITNYIKHRTTLIRDIAADRRGVVYC